MPAPALRRRRFLQGAAATFASIGIVRAPARAAQFEYKVAHDLPIDHPLHVRMVQLWKDVEKETGGRITATIFPASQLGGQTAVLGQLRSGAVQFFSTISGVFSEVVPAVAIDSVGFAFKAPQEPWKTMDGPLGAYVRKEFEAKGLFALEKEWDLGLRQVTSSTKPIKDINDFANFRIRTPNAKISLDLFRTLGASPAPISASELYTALQTHIVDGQETPLLTIETFKLFEVQKYLSLTSHMWTGYWVVANGDAWKALPPDIQNSIQKHASKYAVLERNDVFKLNNSLADKLKSQGFVFNTVDTAPMKAKLAPYYARWKAELGSTAWDLLEASVGKLG